MNGHTEFSDGIICHREIYAEQVVGDRIRECFWDGEDCAPRACGGCGAPLTGEDVWGMAVFHRRGAVSFPGPGAEGPILAVRLAEPVPLPPGIEWLWAPTCGRCAPAAWGADVQARVERVVAGVRAVLAGAMAERTMR